MNSCVVFLERPPSSPDSPHPPLPRKIKLFEAPCDLFWKDASPLCRYCCQEAHWKQDCPKLATKRVLESLPRAPPPPRSQSPKRPEREASPSPPLPSSPSPSS